jgi:hypothetical protein
MRSQEFVRPYSPEIHVHSDDMGLQAQYMGEARYWGDVFGTVLHNVMRGEGPGFTNSLDDQYAEWSESGMPETARQLNGLEPISRTRGLRELHFNILNTAMRGMWEPLVQDGWDSPEKRRKHNKFAQEQLAIQGLQWYAEREMFVVNGDAHRLFEPDQINIHTTLTGMIQKVDTALVLLEVVRKDPDLTVIPTPPVFSRTRKPQLNMNFALIDHAQSKVAGVRTTSKLSGEKFDAVDHNRIVHVDGDVDFNNVRSVRTRRTSSDQRTISWPGLVAAKRMERIKTYGAATAHTGMSPTQLIKLKAIARSMTRGLRLDYDALPGIISSRILEKL